MIDKKKSTVSRYRNFATVIYPDSAPPNWLDVISDAKVASFLSPYHCFDERADKTEKKGHYHYMVMFDGKKSTDQAREFFSTFGGVGCEVVASTRGYARYLCHLDDPDKHQYSADDVKSFGGADYNSVIGLPTDRFRSISEMEDFCEKYNVNSFYLLSRYASAHRADWHRVLCESASVYMREYLKSRKWSIETGQTQIIDSVNGDIIL